MGEGLIELVVVVLALSGAALNAHKILAGFYVWFIANLLGVVLFLMNGLYLMGGLYAVFACLNVYGVYRWTR